MTDPSLVIKGGVVVDGTGAEPRQLDVAIYDGRVVELGSNLVGDETVDATGLIVAPGFIDIHTHYDAQVCWDPWLSPSSQLGVTSVVAGNCGFSLAPCRPEGRDLMVRTLEAVEDMSAVSLAAGVTWNFETYPEYLAALAARGLGINFGGYIGHTALRMWAMGEAAYERPANPLEIALMKETLFDAVTNGALGFSTDRGDFVRGADGRRVPSVVATRDEIEALAPTLNDVGRGVFMASPGNEQFEWMLAELAPRLTRPFTWSPILESWHTVDGEPLWQRKLNAHLTARESGLDVHPQVSSRALTFEFSMEGPLVFYEFDAFSSIAADTQPAERARAYSDPGWRSLARAQSARSGMWDLMVIAHSDDPALMDRSVVQLAADLDSTPFDFVIDLAVSEGLRTRFRTAAANRDVDVVTKLLTTPGAVLGLSDAGAHVGQLCDAVLPLDFLAGWVRDRRVMTMEEGIRKLTGEPAHLMRLADRGELRPGAWADLVVLDWDQLDPGPIRRVADQPGGSSRLTATEPVGVRDVMVNGAFIRREGEPMQDYLPGMLLETYR